MDKIQRLIPSAVDTELVFFVNGKKVIEQNPDPEWTLLWYLRKKLHLTGTKYGCGEGGCGACTVMVSSYLSREDRIKHISVNACITPVCAMHGLAVTTVEGIGSVQEKLHPVQERIAKAHGSQCGFCTPGIVMSMYTLLRNKIEIDYADIETALQGNLCRCTGYRPIIEGFKTFIDAWRGSEKSKNICVMGSDCCRTKKASSNNGETLFIRSEFQPYDPTQEPIFPPELILNPQYRQKLVIFKGENSIWIRPKTLDQLLLLKSEFEDSKIIVGNSEIGIEMKYKKKIYPILLSPSLIDDMNIISVTDAGIRVGAAVTLTNLRDFLRTWVQDNYDKGKILLEIENMLHWFAGNQVRNVACIAGNIVTASPISDLNPIFMACSATLIVVSFKRGQRQVVIDGNFFEAYRKVSVKQDEIVVAIEIPFTESRQYFKAYKQARRRDDDISIVTAAFYVKLEKNYNVVEDAKLCFGGMAPTTICANKSSQLLKGCLWDERTLEFILKSLSEEFELDISAPGGMVDYRKSLSLSLFFKFYLHILQSAGINGYRSKEFQLCELSELSKTEPKSSQCIEIKNKDKNIYDSVGLPIAHVSAMKQATGEAIYCDDIPTVEGELFLCLVLSTEPHAKIINIDPSKALLIPGVVAFLSAADLSDDCNKMGPIIKDEQIFSSHIVTSRACVIGAIIARTENVANKAKDFVAVTYQKIHPVIVTIEDAIKHKSFFAENPRTLEKGNVNEAFSNAHHVFEGEIRTGAQEHFYLETISAFATRKEDELEIICSSQNPAEIAQIAAEVLQIPRHRVIAKVKRIGGGFGGKETRASILAVPVAIAAYKLKKPIRAVLSRDEDMQISGYRHPCLIKYKVAFDNDGKIKGAAFEIYSNAGYSMDISCAMMERIITHVDNCYFIPNIAIKGYVCKTNMPSNTAFRGFGAPKAMLAAEVMIRDIARVLGKQNEEIASINLYQEGHLTHFNQTLNYCTIQRCWNECVETSYYWQRKKEVEEFNSCNRWKKKGIAIVPTKYGISFQIDVLMQAGALVLIYTDGSVLLSIGGIEMGQGLFTKMIQVASKALNIDIKKIHISEMATDKVPNSSPTAASMSSDLYGMAVINACNTLNDRLKPYKENKPDGQWEDWILAAYLDRVCLSATGFYAAPKIEYNAETNAGNLFEYFTYGVACSEVIIDCLTGDHQVLKTDIVMDIGESLNPAIDVGQVEGAFMQGYGYYTLEEMLFSPRGEVLSRGPGTYKIPGFSDIPKEFNVSLLKGAPNPRAVYSSKHSWSREGLRWFRPAVTVLRSVMFGVRFNYIEDIEIKNHPNSNRKDSWVLPPAWDPAVGEPPLFLAASVFFAIKEAINSARLDAGVSTDFVFDVPATCARIRMACEDNITEKVKLTITKNGTPWNVVA